MSTASVRGLSVANRTIGTIADKVEGLDQDKVDLVDLEKEYATDSEVAAAIMEVQQELVAVVENLVNPKEEACLLKGLLYHSEDDRCIPAFKHPGCPGSFKPFNTFEGVCPDTSFDAVCTNPCPTGFTAAPGAPRVQFVCDIEGNCFKMSRRSGPASRSMSVKSQEYAITMPRASTSSEAFLAHAIEVFLAQESLVHVTGHARVKSFTKMVNVRMDLSS